MGTADRDKSGSSKKRYDGQLMSGMGLPRFVERTAALLDLERNAEKEEALRALESKTAESTRRAVARGRCLRSLRCTHVEGGLLGRSLAASRQRSRTSVDVSWGRTTRQTSKTDEADKTSKAKV